MRSLWALGAGALILSSARWASSQPPRTAPAEGGPTLELAPEHQPEPAQPPIGLGAGTVKNDEELARGMTEQRFRAAVASTSSTSIGGYGELLVWGVRRGENGERDWKADIPRLVLFVAHSFDERFRAYSELEVEHALACSTCPGAVELEQAYVDWRVLGDSLALRAGLVLVPMGIINQWHEPPIYLGAVRPRVETAVIPSTWREIGAGLTGNPIGPLRFEAYAMTGLDPSGFSARGIGGGRQNGASASANGPAFVARVEIEPVLGVLVGASGYASDAGGNTEHHDAAGEELDISVPVVGWSVDARWHKWGLEWKLLYAEWSLPESGELMTSRDEDGVPRFDPQEPLPTRIRGAYVELGYDVLRPTGSSHQLVPFARLERYDTQAAVPDGFAADASFAVTQITAGAAYRPIQQVVVKADYQLRRPLAGAPDEDQINIGFGFMY